VHTKKQLAEIRSILQRPILDEEVQWRVDQTYAGSPPRARLLAYIDRTAAMDRLDAAFGFAGWQKTDEHWDGGAKCTISAWLNDMWVGKSGIGSPSNMEALKGASSDALKRACSSWGIGRNLYRLDTTFVDVLSSYPDGAPKCRVVKIYDRKKDISGWAVAPSIREMQWGILTIEWRVQHIQDSRERRLARFREACKDAVVLGLPKDMLSQFIWAVSSYDSGGGTGEFVQGVEDPRQLSNVALKLASHRAAQVVEEDHVSGHINWANSRLEESKTTDEGGES
jgi:hypothetical protein